MAAKRTVFAHTAPLEKQFKEIAKHIKDNKTQRKIHRTAGNVIKKEMIGNIRDARETIRLRRGHTKRSATFGKPYKMDIPVGTLRRSVKVWLISNQQNAYWVGPRVGRRAPVNRDGWFANIVEGGDQFIKGSNRNKDVFFKSITAAAPKAFDKMRQQYRKEIAKTVNATRRK
tara:strand:- start:554 stop:1069 length:516 start_codon:yes stop_codon:yes gene_type:complete